MNKKDKESLKILSKLQLEKKLEELKNDLVRAKIKLAGGQVKDVKLVSKIKDKIAVVMTYISKGDKK